MTESKEKNYTGKKSILRFCFRIRFVTFWIDSDQKILTLSFFFILAKNRGFRCYLDFVAIIAFWSKSTFGAIGRIWSKSVFEARVAFRSNYLFGVRGRASELLWFCSHHSFLEQVNFYKYIEMIPVKFSTTLIFSSRNFKFFTFWWTVYKDEK